MPDVVLRRAPSDAGDDMRAAILVFSLGLAAAGCSKADPTPQELEEKYNWLVANHGDDADKCEAAKKVKAAYLDKKDDLDYMIWRQKADRACNPLRGY